MKSIRKITDRTFDVHLMIENPDRYLKDFKEAGADILTVQVEACVHLDRTVNAIKELGCKAGVSLNPSTPLCIIEHVLPLVDMVLIMSVNPGFGGQSYIDYSTEKIRNLRRMIDDLGLKTDIQVDGGISLSNLEMVLEAGANVIVSGTSVFKGDIEKNIQIF
jgi:ribulose-phosphate 3-epimerase